MRRLSGHKRGLSEIVGTLMLVVIVVSAATLLAAFVATYQKQLQTEEAFSHDQSLESIKILGLVTSLNPAGSAYQNINFTLASEYVNPSTILYISIDNYPLVKFWWEDLTTHVWTDQALGTNLNLAPQQEIYVSTNTNPSNNSFLFAPPTPSQYLKFDVFTALQNDFSHVFLPPTAFGVVSEINPSGGDNPITLLDGSQSFQPGGNASIVNWSWEVSRGALGPTPYTSSAGDAIVSQSGPNGPTDVDLYSYTGTATATFTVPPSFAYVAGDPVYPTAPITSYITNSGSGCTVASASFSTTSGTQSGTSVTVQFSFATTFTCPSLTPGTVMFSGTDDVTLANYILANGEEVELSPALPSGSGAYSVLLVVTNSDGLLGSTTLSYTSP